MGIEIDYDSSRKEFYARHDGQNFSIEDLIKHIRDNGHGRMPVGYGVPPEAYAQAGKIKKEINNIFDEKEAIFK